MDWIEQWFRIATDNGDGMLELLIGGLRECASPRFDSWRAFKSWRFSAAEPKGLVSYRSRHKGAISPTSSSLTLLTRSLTGTIDIPPVYGTHSFLAVASAPVSHRL